MDLLIIHDATNMNNAQRQQLVTWKEERNKLNAEIQRLTVQRDTVQEEVTNLNAEKYESVHEKQILDAQIQEKKERLDDLRLTIPKDIAELMEHKATLETKVESLEREINLLEAIKQ